MRSQDDEELRRMAKRANQRLVRLERFEETSGSEPGDAHKMALWYLDGKKRFTESGTKIDSMTAKEKSKLRRQLSNFLNAVGSKVKDVKRELEIVRKQKELMKFVRDDKKDKGSSQVNPLIGDKRKEKAVWDLFKKARDAGLTKSFNYKTIARALAWRVQQAKSSRLSELTRRVTKTLDDLARKEELNRRELLSAIAKS